MRRQNPGSVPSSHWLEIFILTLYPPCLAWTSKTLSYGLFWDLNLSILTIVTSHNRPESNNRLRILPLLKSWRLANMLILLPYVGLLITAMTPRTTSGELSTQITTSDGHLPSWDPDKPGTTVIETERYVKECLLNNNISNFTIDTPAGFSLCTLFDPNWHVCQINP